MSRDRDTGRTSRGRSERGGRDSQRASSGFRYRERSVDDYKKRGDQGGSDFDKYLDDSIKMFKPADGDNCVRILPPTWKEANHYGLDIYLHYEVGPDKQTYLCLHKMKGEDCPICEERDKATKEGDSEYADSLKPNKRVLVYMLDRNDEKEGLQVWSMPWTVDRDLCKLMVDKKTGELLPIDHPEEGYDVEFERKGKAQRTQYIGIAIARRESSLDNDAALEQAEELPLPDALHYFSYDHIQKAFSGSPSKKSSRESDDDDTDKMGSGRRSSRRSEPDMPSFDEVHEMTYDELCAMIDEHKLDINPDDSSDDTQLADWICEDLNIKEEKKTSSRRSSKEAEDDDTESKMAGLRSRRSRD